MILKSAVLTPRPTTMYVKNTLKIKEIHAIWKFMFLNGISFFQLKTKPFQNGNEKHQRGIGQWLPPCLACNKVRSVHILISLNF